MFDELSKEPPEVQALFKRIVKYHFDWSPEEPSQKARTKQVVEWIEATVKKMSPTERHK